MEFQNRHTRHPTWPPTMNLLPDSMTTRSVNIKTRTIQPLQVLHEEEIDEDPFSHFLSPILEDDNPSDEDDYSAGININSNSDYSPTSAQKTARFRARLEERWESFVARRLLSHQYSHAQSHAQGLAGSPPLPATMPSTPPEEDALPDLYIEDADVITPDMESSSPPLFPSMLRDDLADGWEADRLRLPAGQNDYDDRSLPELTRVVTRTKRPNLRSSHTLSGKKHAWREPSWDLWTVDEEDEDDDVDEELGSSRGRGKGRKRNKTVHWDEEVRVLEFER